MLAKTSHSFTWWAHCQDPSLTETTDISPRGDPRAAWGFDAPLFGVLAGQKNPSALRDNRAPEGHGALTQWGHPCFPLAPITALMPLGRASHIPYPRGSEESLEPIRGSPVWDKANCTLRSSTNGSL